MPEVHIGTPVEKCREINKKLLADKDTDGGYVEEDFENLIFRYEEPNGMTRWDSPLFTVLDEDETPPFDQIWEAMVGSDGKRKVVRQNLATVLVSDIHSNHLEQRLTDIPLETGNRAKLPVRARQNHVRCSLPNPSLAKRPPRRRGRYHRPRGHRQID
jgi:tRNA uridine 5-carbamoylmethylation protein Kti12